MVVIRVWIYIGEIGETPLDELANDRGKGNKLVIVGVWCMRSRYVRVVPIKLAFLRNLKKPIDIIYEYFIT